MSLQFVTPIPHRISTRAAHMNASESSCHRQRFRPNSIPRHLPGQPHAATRTAGPFIHPTPDRSTLLSQALFRYGPPWQGQTGTQHRALCTRRRLSDVR